MGHKVVQRQAVDKPEYPGIVIGEWVAQQLVKDPMLIRTMPGVVYGFFRGWLDACRTGEIKSELYEQHFVLEERRKK